MNSPGGATSFPRVTAPFRLVAAVLCSVVIAVPLAQLVSTSSAGAATGGSSPKAQVPRCPPDCGRVAAGDPLLIPFLTPNPGPGWSALPAAGVQSYVDNLKKNLGHDEGVLFNVAAGKWSWVTGQYGLLVVLVSSPSLADLHLQTLAENAQDLCDSAHGVPNGRLGPIAGVPHSVYGTCAIKAGSAVHGATVAVFNHDDVAVLITITSNLNAPIDPRNTALVAQQQFLSLPGGNVLVSRGFDVALLLVWLVLVAGLIASIVACMRRRESWRGPLEAVAEGFGRRKVAPGVAVIAVIGAMAFSMFDFSLLHGYGQWYNSSFDDLWRSWSNAADMTFGGGYGHIFKLDSALETAPTVQVFLAPIARLAFGLSFPYPSAVLYPTAYWVAGPLVLATMALPLCGGDRWLQYMGVTDLRRRLTVLGIMAVTLPPIALDGHPEDLIALGAMLYGLVAALEGRHRAVGWWLGTALAFQFLAFLAVPIALVLLGRRHLDGKQWATTIAPMIVLPLVFLIVPLATEPSATVHQLVHQKVYDISGYITPTWNLDPGVAAFIRALVALVAIPAALVLARTLRRFAGDPANIVVWILALLFALRVFEPELIPYFLGPCLALVPISASRAPWWRFLATCGLAVWITWWLHFAVQARWSSWLILIAQVAVLVALAVPRTPLVVEGRPAMASTPAKPKKPAAKTAKKPVRAGTSSRQRPKAKTRKS